MCFYQDSAIFSLNGKTLELVDRFIYLGSNILSTESDVIILLGKAWTSINRLTIVWKSDLSDKIKREFFQDVTV